VRNDFSFYATPGPLTDPTPFGAFLDGLPTDLGAQCQIVQQTTLHIFWADRYGLPLSEERKSEVQLRSLSRRLAQMQSLDARPLTEPRPLNCRIIGNCRDFTLLLVSILRHQGVPARARCGFGAYFLPDHFEDHWVAEYWHMAERRWVLVDAQLDALQCEALRIPFNPLDVPRDQFLTGGEAWLLCRSGREDPSKFGIFDMHGLGFVRGNFIRDVAALNKVELLPWDCWGVIERESLDLPDDLAMLDALAELTRGDVPEDAVVRDRYQSDPRLRVGSSIHSYLENGMQTIALQPGL
jgi:hypothetical protein